MLELFDDKSGMREIAPMAGLPLTFPLSPKNEHPWTLTEAAVALLPGCALSCLSGLE